MTLLWLLVTVPLTAGDPADAQRLFDRGEFDQALKLLETKAASTPPGPELARVHLLRGRCFAALRSPAQVETAFTQALMNDPDAELDAESVAPDVIETYHALRLRLSGRLTVRLEGLQESDVVRVDSETIAAEGSSVPIGSHVIEVRRAGGVVWQGKVTVRPGQEAVVSGAVVDAGAAERPSLFSAVVRVRVDPLRGATVDLGVELTLPWFRLSLLASKGAFFGVGLRPALVLQFHPRVGVCVFAEADTFVSSPVSLAVGGGVSLDVNVVGPLELFAEGSGFYAALAPDSYRRAYGLLGLGVRWRF